MRPIWGGYISFGLVNIPVSLYAAERHTELKFHMLDSRDKSRVHYQRVNESGKKVPWEKIVKGYEFAKDQYVIIKKEDFKKVATTTKVIDIKHFVGQKDIAYEYFERPYYVVPTKDGKRSYVLLREALKKSAKVAIAKIILHEREHLAAIIAEKDVLILDILRFKQEIVPLKEIELFQDTPKDLKITAQELNIAKQLIDSMSDSWRPELYHDEYHEALMSWIEKKISGKRIPKEKPAKSAATKKTASLSALMKKSIENLKKVTYTNNVIPLKQKTLREKKK